MNLFSAVRRSEYDVFGESEPFLLLSLEIVRLCYRTEMPLFGKSQKNPAEVVKALKEAVTALERGDKKAEKAQEEVSKQLANVKSILFGAADTEQQTEILIAQLSQELYNSHLILLLIKNLSKIEFEVIFFKSYEVKKMQMLLEFKYKAYIYVDTLCFVNRGRRMLHRFLTTF